jgi:hypothetical protein
MCEIVQDFGSSAKNILTPRRKAIERIFNKFDARGDGVVDMGALNQKKNSNKTPRTPRSARGDTENQLTALEGIAIKMSQVRKRLKVGEIVDWSSTWACLIEQVPRLV